MTDVVNTNTSNNEQPKPNLKRYKFRAELTLDLIRFIQRHGYKYAEDIEVDGREAVLVTDKSIDDIRKEMSTIIDTHVMRETLKEEHEYMGQLDWDVDEEPQDITTNNNVPMKRYKFRAETKSDIRKFIKRNGYYDDVEVDGCEVVLTTHKSIDVIRDEMRLQIDTHVMRETLREEHEYTGERDYDVDD